MSDGEPTNPYVGPVPFSTDQKDLFFGRDEEAEKLLSLAISERIVLFYAQSGSGKSSLVNARLIPDLERKGYKVLPVARVGGDPPENVSADKLENVFVFNTLLSLAEGKRGLFGEIKKDARAQIGKSLTDYIAEQALSAETKQHWLIIDQFEEIITTHPTKGLEERKNFFQQLKQMLDADEMLSLVLVMREDHLAGLDSFSSLLPGRLSTRYRIERLKRREAQEAVRSPALKGGRVFEPGAVQHLVNDLSQERIADQESTRTGEYVEPLFLQLVCFSLWKSLDEVKSQKSPEADKVITKSDVETYGDIDQALRKFYDDAVKRVADKTGTTEMAIRRWFGETLIAPTGIRAQVNRGLLKSGGLSNSAVDQLISVEHLIRLEEARGGKWYELSHDRFIKPIQDSNEEWLTGGAGDSRLARSARLWNKLDRDESFLYRGRLLQNAQARYEKNKDAAGALDIEFLTASANAEARRKSQYGWMIAGLVFLLLVASGFAAYAFYKKASATKHYEEMVQLNSQIEKQRAKERELYTWALRDNAEAKRQGNLAETQADEAKRQESLARIAGLKEKDLRQKAEKGKKEMAHLLDEKDKLSKELQGRYNLYRDLYFQNLRSTEARTPTSVSKPGCDAAGNCSGENPVVGAYKWRASNGGFEFLEDWRRNLTPVRISQLENIRSSIAGFDGTVEFYQGGIGQLKALWDDLAAANLMRLVKTWDGSTKYYEQAKLDRPTSHTLGLAFDINSSYGVTIGSQQSRDETVPPQFKAICERHGFGVEPIGPGMALHIQLMRINKSP
jgi:hypothetical protein